MTNEVLPCGLPREMIEGFLNSDSKKQDATWVWLGLMGEEKKAFLAGALQAAETPGHHDGVSNLYAKIPHAEIGQWFFGEITKQEPSDDTVLAAVRGLDISSGIMTSRLVCDLVTHAARMSRKNLVVRLIDGRPDLDKGAALEWGVINCDNELVDILSARPYPSRVTNALLYKAIASKNEYAFGVLLPLFDPSIDKNQCLHRSLQDREEYFIDKMMSVDRLLANPEKTIQEAIMSGNYKYATLFLSENKLSVDQLSACLCASVNRDDKSYVPILLSIQDHPQARSKSLVKLANDGNAEAIHFLLSLPDAINPLRPKHLPPAPQKNIDVRPLNAAWVQIEKFGGPTRARARYENVIKLYFDRMSQDQIHRFLIRHSDIGIDWIKQIKSALSEKYLLRSAVLDKDVPARPKRQM